MFNMNGPALSRNWLCFARSQALKYYCTESEAIKIPNRIHRGPTDILKALSRTHKRDSLAAHYKYHDDPYLIPLSNYKKRTYALSLEAGRKAAHWIRQEHAELFNHRVADPPIEFFVPSKVFKEDSEATLEDLKSTISNFLISDSITIYNSLLKQGVELDADTKQSLLELLCFYNCEETIDEQWLEERWFRTTSEHQHLVKKTWKDGGLAEQVFNSIKPPTAEAYSAIISGMAKYCQVDGAMKLFEEAIAANMDLSVTVFNNILSKIGFLKEDNDLMWKLTLDLLRTMKTKGLKPDLGTFNAVLEMLSQWSNNRNSKRNALQILSEMKALNIEPSLASFAHLLKIFYTGMMTSGILYDVLDYITGKPYEVRDINDCMFYVTAMEVCRYKLHQVPVAFRINSLLELHNNKKFIGNSLRESLYYRFFFSLLCEGQPLDEVMKVYDEMVPHLYTPEPSVMMELLNSVEVNMGFHYLPKLWTDMSQFDLVSRQLLLAKMLELMNQSEDPELCKQFVSIGWNIWEKIEEQTKQRNLVEWTVDMLCNLMKLLLKNKVLSKANLVFDKLDRSQNNLTGEPDISVLKLYLTSSIEKDDINSAIKCVRYCQDMGFGEAEEFASLIETSPSATEQQKQRLNAILNNSPSSAQA